MFKAEANNEKIGQYLSCLIDQKFKSRRAFCRKYLLLRDGDDPTEESLNNMSNRLAQIIKGKKAIQTYDLPYFTNLLEVSCEQILSAGECSVPIASRVTNYSIAYSKDPTKWEEYIQRDDKLVLNPDEYNMTVLDYALEFGNYEFIRFLIDNKYIWFDSGVRKDYFDTFGAGTSIKRRDAGYIDCALDLQLKMKDELRIKLIILAIANDDIATLHELRARELPQLYSAVDSLLPLIPDFNESCSKRWLKYIANSNDVILDYFTETFEIASQVRYENSDNRAQIFMFPYISNLLDLLITNNSPYAEKALRKALRHNENTLRSICKLANKTEGSQIHNRDLYFKENDDLVICQIIHGKGAISKVVTNMAHTTETPASPTLKLLTEQLNRSYSTIKNLKLEEF